MADSLTDDRLRRLAKRPEYVKAKKTLYCPILSAAIAGRDEKAMDLIMRLALKDGISSGSINEIILQSHLFLGFPAMIEAARMFAGIRGLTRKSAKLPEPYKGDACRNWNHQGLRKIRGIYGVKFERLVKYINSFSPQILSWMINDGYGQVLSRPGVSFKLRELSVVATLTVTGYEHQLKAHIRGTLNHGVGFNLIDSTIRNTRYFCPSTNIRQALDILTGINSTNAKKI